MTWKERMDKAAIEREHLLDAIAAFRQLRAANLPAHRIASAATMVDRITVSMRATQVSIQELARAYDFRMVVMRDLCEQNARLLEEAYRDVLNRRPEKEST